VPLPEPEIGLVVRYEYVWADRAGRVVNADKDHPACVVVTWRDTAGARQVVYLAITHSRPAPPDFGIELSADTKKAAGLDARPQWVVISQANRDEWGLDLRQIPGRPGVFHYGHLPPRAFETIRAEFEKAYLSQRVKLVGKR